MKLAILTANLGKFDQDHIPVLQEFPGEVVFHSWTDKNFPPVAGLTPRLQYRLPKTQGWDMFPGYDVYIWLDGAMSFERSDCVQYFMDQLGNNDMAFFRHPFGRRKIRHEVAHIEEKIKQNHPYIVPRYGGGFHKELLEIIQKDTAYKDRILYASTAFIYRNIPAVQSFLKDWLYSSVRYFTCDQIALPYLLWKHKIKVSMIDDNLFKSGYVSLMNHHR